MDSSDPESRPSLASDSEDEEEEHEDIQELGQTVANYLIDAHSMRIIVKKKDLIKNCLQQQRKLYNDVLGRARAIIRDTFGYDVKEGQHNSDCLLFLVDSSGGLDADLIDDLKLKRRQTLLFLVLGYMTMKTPPVPEISITNFLEKLGIDMIDDPEFGNVKDLLAKQFINEYYLKQTKQVDQASGEQTIYYDWGVRSTVEVNRDDMLNVFSEILGKPVRSFVQLPGQPSNSQR